MSELPESTVSTKVNVYLQDNKKFINFTNVPHIGLESIDWIPLQDVKLEYASFSTNTQLPAAGGGIGINLQIINPSIPSQLTHIFQMYVDNSCNVKDTMRFQELNYYFPAGTLFRYTSVNSTVNDGIPICNLQFSYKENSNIFPETVKKCDLINWILGRCE